MYLLDSNSIPQLPLWLVISVIGLLALAMVVMLLIAIFSGREISLWPPKIGPVVIKEPEKPNTNIITDAVAKDEYGIEILSPGYRDEVKSPIRVTGTFSQLPPVDQVYAIVLNEKTNEYWPKGPLLFDTGTNRWSVDLNIDSSNEVKERIIIIASLGSYAKDLINHFKKVGAEKNAWVGIKYNTIIRDDIHRICQVTVRVSAKNK